ARGFTVPPVPCVSGGGLSYTPNKSLDSEEIWSYQGGFETAAAKYFWIKATYFFHNLHKELNLDQTKGLFINHGKTRRQGFEFEAQTIPFYNFTCLAGFSYVHIKSSEKSDTENKYTYSLSIKYDDKKTFYAALFGGYTWWNIEDEAFMNSNYDTFIWDLNINKKLNFKRNLCPEIFLTAHNIFNGSQYVQGDFKNPRRWVEAGLRVRF
nr:TonB-dependent receptor [Desulfobacterales bacterium]